MVEEQKILGWLDRLSRTKTMTAVEAIVVLADLSIEVGQASITYIECVELLLTIEGELSQRVSEILGS